MRLLQESRDGDLTYTRRHSLVGQAAASMKPKPPMLQKMLAAAMQVSGVDVEDYLGLQKREHDEVGATSKQLRCKAATSM